MDLRVLSSQLEGALDEYSALARRSRYPDLTDLPVEDRQAIVSKMSVAIRMASIVGSTYAKELDQILLRDRLLHTQSGPVAGLARALLENIRAGYTRSLVELVHAELFADFLEMAQHLLAAGFKDASAVLAGSTLEAHLRALCALSGVSTIVAQPNGGNSPKKADQMNADLAKAGTYSKLDQKNVTAWLDLRNKAAHGQYGDYSMSQVELLCAGIREFIGRNPA